MLVQKHKFLDFPLPCGNLPAYPPGAKAVAAKGLRDALRHVMLLPLIRGLHELTRRAVQHVMV
jgi:hypothetical protein